MMPQSSSAPVETLRGPMPTRSATPMRDALACLAAELPPGLDLRIGVADVTDGTGAMVDSETMSRALTQRPDLMMVVALAQAGVRLVNRSSTAVAEWELKQALERRLGDGSEITVGGNTVKFRPVQVGGILGSTHYVIGALTELNWNVDSGVAEVGAFGFAAGTRGYYISIAFDVLITNTATTEIAMARAYNKQLFGREMKAGFFRFFDIGRVGRNVGPFELFEASIGSKKNEPVQTAVRWVIETAAFDMVRELANLGDACEEYLPGAAQIPAVPVVETVPVVAPVPEQIEPVPDTRVPEVGPLRTPQPLPMIPVIPGHVIGGEIDGKDDQPRVGPGTDDVREADARREADEQRVEREPLLEGGAAPASVVVPVPVSPVQPAAQDERAEVTIVPEKDDAAVVVAPTSSGQRAEPGPVPVGATDEREAAAPSLTAAAEGRGDPSPTGTSVAEAVPARESAANAGGQHSNGSANGDDVAASVERPAVSSRTPLLIGASFGVQASPR